MSLIQDLDNWIQDHEHELGNNKQEVIQAIDTIQNTMDDVGD